MNKKIILKNKKWELIIDLEGGRIVKLEKDRQKILGTFNRIDGKTGNTHVCVPNFAAEGAEKFGFIFHGPFRNGEWSVIRKSENSIEISYEVENLLVNQIFEIGDDFSQRVKVKNVGNEKKKVHVAIHNYWDTKFGWSGVKLNGHDITAGFVDNPEIKLEKNNILEIPEKKIITWQVENLKKAKLWTGVKDEKGKKVFDEKYVCIEPEMEYEGFVETDKSWLKPKGKLIVKQTIGQGVVGGMPDLNR